MIFRWMAIRRWTYVDLELLKTSCFAALKNIQQHADKVQAEVDEAERIRAEQNMTEMEMLRRAVYHLASRVTKLEGVQSGHLPGLPHVARSEVPQMVGLQKEWDGIPWVRPPAAGSGKSVPLKRFQRPDAMSAGYTRRIHPLNVIGGGAGEGIR